MKFVIYQGVGFAICWLTAVALGVKLLDFPLLFAVFQGVSASIVSGLRRDPIWWVPIHLCFVPMAVLVSRWAVPPWLWLAAFLILLMVFWRIDKSQVPLFLTNAQAGTMIAGLIPATPVAVLDLGCGDGGLLRQLARLRPDSRFVGIEHAPLTWAWAWWRSRHLPNLTIRWGSFWAHPLAQYDVVYAFLSPAPMSKLWRKASAEMTANALLISNSFEAPEQRPERTIAVSDARKTLLFCYRPGGRNNAENKRPDCPPA